jgi:cytochrome bd-type quinol oxidase subunit 2
MTAVLPDEDVDLDAPPAVVGAVAAGSVPVPFLAVYAVIFVVHGRFHPVVPPDVTDTPHGEFVVGIVAAVLFLVALVAVIMMLNGSRRWPFLVVESAVVAGAVDLLVDNTRGGGATAVVIGVAALLGIVLALLPPSWSYLAANRRARRRRRAAYPAHSSLPTKA